MQRLEEKTRAQLFAVSLSILVLVAFWQIQYHDFLLMDDYAYIVENPHVRSGLSMDNLKWAFTTSHASYWHPLTWLSHMLECQWFGTNPRGHHFNSLLIHLVNSLLLFLFLYKATGSLWRSAFVSAVFSIHPLRIESVAWAAERKDLLGAFFWMVTLLSYSKYVRQPTCRNYLFLLLPFALGLMTKPMLVTLPFALLLLDYWPFHRFTFGPRESALPECRPSPARLVAEKIPLFVLSAASSLVTFWVVNASGGINSPGIPFSLRLGNALISYVTYLKKLFWPFDLAILYPHPLDSLPIWQAIVSCALLLMLSILVALQGKRRPYLPLGWLWFLGILFPVNGIVQAGIQSSADRFTYIPHVGLYIILAWGVHDLVSTWSRRRLFLSLTAFLFLFFLTLSTRTQLRHWNNSISLFSRTTEVTSNNYFAHQILGQALARQGRLDEAVGHYEESLNINPGAIPPRYNLAYTLQRQGKMKEAGVQYECVLRLNPRDASAHNNLGNVLARMGKTEEASDHFRMAIEIDPCHAFAHNNLANICLEKGNQEEAIRHYSEALRIEPDFEQARNGLNRALHRTKTLKPD